MKRSTVTGAVLLLAPLGVAVLASAFDYRTDLVWSVDQGNSSHVPLNAPSEIDKELHRVDRRIMERNAIVRDYMDGHTTFKESAIRFLELNQSSELVMQQLVKVHAGENDLQRCGNHFLTFLSTFRKVTEQEKQAFQIEIAQWK